MYIQSEVQEVFPVDGAIAAKAAGAEKYAMSMSMSILEENIRKYWFGMSFTATDHRLF